MNSSQQAILELAKRSLGTATQTDEFDTPTMTNGMNSDLLAAVKELQAEEAKQVVKDAAREIIKIVATANAHEARLIEGIRNARRRAKAEEESYQSQLKKIRAAKEYAGTSNNYLPLMVATGEFQFNRGIVEDNQELFMIPVVTVADKKATTTKRALK